MSTAPLPTLDGQALEKAREAVRTADGCGLSIDGATVFCDDARLEGLNDGYGRPLLCAQCFCKEHADAAVTAYLAATPQPVADAAGRVTEERLIDDPEGLAHALEIASIG